jgi:glycine/D-amino acid oxidase-like deaminating enzyme
VRVGGHVVNAAGPWSAELAGRLGSWLPVRPRRGHVLVTEPLGPVARHKVSEAGYLASVHAGDWSADTGGDDPSPAGRPAGDAVGRDAVCAAVIESTLSGTILIGSSRQLVGFDRRLDPALMAELARRAIAVFPFLSGVRMMRAYVGFRPASPDGLPIIGPDAHVDGLVHATGHEGAGIGLAEATAELVEALVAGGPPPEEAAAFAPSRFSGAMRFV